MKIISSNNCIVNIEIDGNQYYVEKTDIPNVCCLSDSLGLPFLSFVFDHKKLNCIEDGWFHEDLFAAIELIRHAI